MEQIRVSYQLVVTVMCLVCLGSSVGISSESDPLIRTYVSSSSLQSNDDLVYSVQRLTESEWDSLVIKSKLPVMVMFLADWCGVCHAMPHVLNRLDSDFKDKFKFYTVDVDEEQGIAARYGIRSLPATIIFKGGDQKTTYIGFNSRKLRVLVEQYV